MIHIYGIKNCDVVQKALKWLDARKVPYTFHNYKDTGLDAELLEHWLNHIPVSKLINTRSTTFRELNDDEKASIQTKAGAIALIMKYTSIVKRPVWQFPNNDYLLGRDEKELIKRIG